MFNLAFLNWDTLATFSGAVGLTVIVVQLLKLPLDKVWKIPTRYIVYVVCLAIMLLAQYFTAHALSLEVVAITAINAFVGTLTAMALYERAIELPEWEKLNTAIDYMHTGELPSEAHTTETASDDKVSTQENSTDA